MHLAHVNTSQQLTSAKHIRSHNFAITRQIRERPAPFRSKERRKSLQSNVPHRRHVVHFVGTNNRDRHKACTVASLSVAKSVREAIETAEAAVKCFLSHSCACFKRSELVIVLPIWLREFGILSVIVPTIGNSNFPYWNLVFEFTSVHFVVRVGTSRKRPFQPHQFGFKKIKSQLVRKTGAVVFV